MSTRKSLELSFTAASDLSAKQNLFLKYTADNTVDVCGAGGDGIGVQGQTKALSGQAVDVLVGPRIPITLNATLTAGAEVMSDASGKAIAWTTTNRSLGYLIEGGGAGDVVAMHFAINGRKA
jgi:hypothetical protein